MGDVSDLQSIPVVLFPSWLPRGSHSLNRLHGMFPGRYTAWFESPSELPKCHVLSYSLMNVFACSFSCPQLVWQNRVHVTLLCCRDSAIASTSFFLVCLLEGTSYLLNTWNQRKYLASTLANRQRDKHLLSRRNTGSSKGHGIWFSSSLT